MHAWQSLSYSLLLLLVAALLTTLALSAWRRRPAEGATLFVLFLCSVILWSLAYAVELGLEDIPSKILWAKTRYLGITVVPVAWFAFVLRYIGQERWVNHPRFPLLLLIPMTTLLLVWSNEAHELIWRGEITAVQVGTSSMLVLREGWWFWVHTAYSYLLLLMGTILFLGKILRSPGLYRGQAATLMIGALIPWLFNIAYVFDYSPFGPLDLTPFAFGLSGLAVGWSLFYFRLLDIVPVARGALVDRMNEGVLVLDHLGRLVDLNPAALRLLGAQVIGQPLAHVEPLMAALDEAGEMQREVVLEQQGERLHFDVRVSPLFSRRERLTGHLVLLHDITERKQAEAALAESEERFRRLADATLEGIVIHDKGLILEANRAVAEMFGYEPSEIIGQQILEFIAPDSRDLVEEAMLSGYEQPYQALGLKKNRSHFHIEILGKALPYQGRVVRVAATRDITAHKEAQAERDGLIQQLREALTRTEALYRAAHMLIGRDNLPTMLQAVVDSTVTALSAYQVLLLTLDPGNGRVRQIVVGGEGAAEIDPLLCQPSIEGLISADATRILNLSLQYQGESLGLIRAIPHPEAPPFSAQDRELLETMANQAAIAIENARLFEEVQWRATRDGLTGIYSRRHFFELGEAALRKAKYEGRPLSAIMLDIDHFKRINDNYGHAVGDQVLRAVADICQDDIRGTDILGRYGGEEFSLLLPETDIVAAQRIAERLRLRLGQAEISTNSGLVKVTASMGLAPLLPTMPDLTTLLDQADSALYAAKEAGRNRVMVRMVQS